MTSNLSQLSFEGPAAERTQTLRAAGSTTAVGDGATRKGNPVYVGPGPAIRLATAGQRRFALAISLLGILMTALLLPFAQIAWPNIPAFLPTFQTAAIGTCLITAGLMYGHYSATKSTVLLHLSAGYVYTAAILLMQFLSFPGVLSESGRIFGGPRSASWLWAFWHIGPACSILFYAWCEHRRPVPAEADQKHALLRAAVVLLAAIVATGLLVTVFHDSLPILDVNGKYSGITALSAIAIAVELMLAAALVLLWRASLFRNVLHVWLGVVVIALLCDNAITIFAGSRLALGWYIGRLIALAGFSVLMLVYLHEVFSSYRRSVTATGQLAFQNAQLDRDIEQRTAYAQALLEADQSKDRFLVTLAHELRGPLAPISNAACMLASGRLDETAIKKTGEVLRRQVRQMTNLVADLLDVSRVTRGLAVLQSAPVDAKELLASAVEQSASLVESGRHVLEVQQPEEPVFVLADRDRMVQVITNLLNNSAKYTQPGGSIVLRLELRGADVVFSVMDNGIGMTPELLERAFRLFSQAELTSERIHGGLGIGLALVKSLVELHGGQVYATSRGLGLGSEFHVALPRLLT